MDEVLIEHHDGKYPLGISSGFSTTVWVIMSQNVFRGINVGLASALRKKKEAYNELHGALLLQCFDLSNSLLVTLAGRGSSYVLNCTFLKIFVLLC